MQRRTATAAAAAAAAAATPDEVRCHIAAACRWMARMDLHEGVANHTSVCVDGGSRMLINPGCRHYSTLKASDIVSASIRESPAGAHALGVDTTAFALHAAIHRHFGDKAVCVMHAHPLNATVLSTLQDKTLPPLDQNAARFFNRVKIDTGFAGMALGDEPQRMVDAITPLGMERVILMGNHGVTTLGPTVGDAFDALYHFERSCAIYIRALSTGQPLDILPDDVAERTARQWEGEYGAYGSLHFAELLRILDAEEPQYKA